MFGRGRNDRETFPLRLKVQHNDVMLQQDYSVSISVHNMSRELHSASLQRRDWVGRPI